MNTVEIVKVTDVDVAAKRRHMLQSSGGISVEFTVEVDSTSTGDAAIAKIKTASTSGDLVTAFKSGGLAAVTTVETTKSGVVTVDVLDSGGAGLAGPPPPRPPPPCGQAPPPPSPPLSGRLSRSEYPLAAIFLPSRHFVISTTIESRVCTI